VLDGPYPSRTKSGAVRKFPWDEMKVGESFIIANRKMASFGGTLSYANASRYPKKFRSRTIGPDLQVMRVK
jgi:hypothetical protein